MQCAAAPHLQEIQGCFTDTPRVFRKFDGYEFTRCPVRYHSARAMALVRAVRLGEARWGNSKGEEAWRYVEHLIRLQELQERAARDGN